MVVKVCEKVCIVIIIFVDICIRRDYNVGIIDLIYIYINCIINFYWKEWLW